MNRTSSASFYDQYEVHEAVERQKEVEAPPLEYVRESYDPPKFTIPRLVKVAIIGFSVGAFVGYYLAS